LYETVLDFLQNTIEIYSFAGQRHRRGGLMIRPSIMDDVVWKIRRLNRPTLVQHHEAFNEILHLSDVSWPAVPPHDSHGLAIDLNSGFPPSTHVQRQKMTDEKRYIRVALPQRWQFQWKNVQTIKEILPKFPLPHRNPKIPIGRRDDSDIDLHSSVAAHRLKLPLLKYP